MCFSSEMQMYMAIVDQIPDPNTIVHGIFTRGELHVPMMWFSGRKVVTGMPSDAEDKCMELKVRRIALNDDPDPNIEFEFLRFVQIQD